MPDDASSLYADEAIRQHPVLIDGDRGLTSEDVPAILNLPDA